MMIMTNTTIKLSTDAVTIGEQLQEQQNMLLYSTDHAETNNKN